MHISKDKQRFPEGAEAEVSYMERGLPTGKGLLFTNCWNRLDCLAADREGKIHQMYSDAVNRENNTAFKRGPLTDLV